MSNVSYVLTEDAVTLFDKQTGTPKYFSRAQNPKEYASIARQIIEGKELSFDNLSVNVTEQFYFKHKDMEVNQDGIFIRGEKYDGNEQFTKGVQGLVKSGKDVTRFLNMVELLSENPYEYVWKYFFDWLARTNLYILEDGWVLGYKSVRPDFTDWYTGKIDNSVGAKVVALPHWKCDTDSHKSCSEGYHIGTYAYAKGFHSEPGRNIVLCKFHPKDVMAVPHEGREGKIRVRYYEVVATHEGNELDSNVPLVKYNGEVVSADEIFVNDFFTKVDDDYEWEGSHFRDEEDYDEEDYEDEDWNEDVNEDFDWEDEEPIY